MVYVLSCTGATVNVGQICRYPYRYLHALLQRTYAMFFKHFEDSQSRARKIDIATYIADEKNKLGAPLQLRFGNMI